MTPSLGAVEASPPRSSCFGYFRRQNRWCPDFSRPGFSALLLSGSVKVSSSYMTKIDHERRNFEEKAKKTVPESSVAGSTECKTVRGKPKKHWNSDAGAGSRPRRGYAACPKCGVHVREKKLRKHVIDIHRGFRCPLCALKLDGAKQLRKHVKCTHGKAELKRVNRALRVLIRRGH